MNSLPKTVTHQHRDCDLNPSPSVHESSMLTTRLLSHPTTKIHSEMLDADRRQFGQCGGDAVRG